MSQLVLDDQLDIVKVLPGLRRWTSAVRLQSLRPGQHIFDDRVPEILLTCHEPTFVTIDADFWKSTLCHAGYCIVFVDIDFRHQHELPKILRQWLRIPPFRSRAERMGKVIRLTELSAVFWDVGAAAIQQAPCVMPLRKRRRKS